MPHIPGRPAEGHGQQTGGSPYSANYDEYRRWVNTPRTPGEPFATVGREQVERLGA